MPTASTESSVDKKGPLNAQSTIEQALGIVDRKVRNLEKRKNKLDQIKAKAASGAKLEADQQNAIEKYNEVVYSLEYSRELQKQFSAISNEAGKLLKKQERKQKQDRRYHEMKRIQELLKVQNLLDSLGNDDIRSDFQTGKHGAVVLTEENLTHLDELYQLISPTREGEGSYHNKVHKAADHIISLLEAKEKEVLGTTYKELKDLIDLISGCGYFEVVQKLETDAQKTTAESTDAEGQEAEANSEVVSTDDGKSEAQEDDDGDLDINVSGNQDSLGQVAPSLGNMGSSEDDSYYAGDVYQNAPINQRPIDEIVSSVQGSFDFLQESTIDVDSVAHADPAVVAAQPMARQTAPPSQDSESRSLSGFGTQAYDQSSVPAASQQNNRTDQRYNTDQSAHSTQNMDYPNSQPFRQNALAQNLQSESALFPPPGKDMLNQQGQDPSLSQYDIPPTIPMPQSQDNQQSNISNQSEKKFTMNASAPVFQSMYSQQGAPDEGGDGNNHFGQNSDNGNYQNNRYNDGFQQRGSRREGGGYRNNRGGGGGRGGNNNMQNGFNNRNNTSGDRGGQNGQRGGRGGQYQGYQTRNNYQSDGYQGYNNNGSRGYDQSGYKGRGGNSGQGMRGSGMRGGAGRGGGGNGGGPRGGSRGGGFGRTNSGSQYQQ